MARENGEIVNQTVAFEERTPFRVGVLRGKGNNILAEFEKMESSFPLLLWQENGKG